MNVLHVVPSIAPSAGGPARSVPTLVRALRTLGVNGRIAASGAAGDDVPLSHAPGPGEWPTPSSVRRLAASIAGSDVVEIHSLWNGTSSVAASLCRRAGVPYVLAPRGMLAPACLATRRLLKRAYGWLVEDATIAGAGGFHFLSEEERRETAIGPVAGDRETAVAPNSAPAVPTPLPRGVLRTRFPEVGGGQVALHLGRLDPIKGIDLQLHAMAALEPAERPRLLVVGPDYGQRAALTSLARQLRLEAWVVWGEPVYGDERFSLLADADAVLLTSRYDANPVLLAEAVAAGAVLVGTAGCGGVDAAARAGAVCQVARTSEAVAGALRRLLRDPEAAAALRRRAQHYAGTALSPQHTLAPLIDLYARLRGAVARPRRTA